MFKNSDVQCVLVTRKTRLQGLIERFNTLPQAKFYLEHNDVDVNDYLVEHDQYQQCLAEAEKVLRAMGRLQVLERSFLPNYSFSSNDIVVVIGQDGLVANTLKYLSGQSVIAVNPDPQRFDGGLLPFELHQLQDAVRRTLVKDVDINSITFAEARTNDGQRMMAVNDLFIGPKTHTSARYSLTWQGQTEEQSSSGIIVSTGFGSSGWFQSVLAGALAVTGQSQHPLQEGFAWGAEFLQFSVREPFPSQTTGASLVFGEISHRQPLTIESRMPENGVVFSDGIEDDFIAFNSGCVIEVAVAKTQGRLVVE